MSSYFEEIPRVIWGSGLKGYGDENPKEKAIAMMEKEERVFVGQAALWGYEKRYGVKAADKNCATLYASGFLAVAVPSQVAVQMLKDYRFGMFNDFALRDIHKIGADKRSKIRLERGTDEHLLLDFEGGIYSDNRSDHCYD